MTFKMWIETVADENDKLDLIDSVDNAFFEGEVWERFDWLGIEYTKDEVREWARAEYERMEGEE